jgi:hypothetical protein
MCGNDPFVIAFLMKEAIELYGGSFKKIVFAIPEGPNYNEFHDVLKPLFERFCAKN